MAQFKIATFGCSHTSYMAGDPWPIPLAKLLDCKLIESYSPGSGNEINVAKVNQVLDECNPNLAIVQLTDPARLTLGLDYESCYKRVRFLNYIGDNNTGNVPYYTFNHTGNTENLEYLLEEKFHKDVDKLIIRHIITSEYNLYHKVIHTMLAMENIAKSYRVPIVFFSWSVDVNDIIKKSGYITATKKLNIIPDYIESFVIKKKLKPVLEGYALGHHPTENHNIIAEEFILPYLKSRGLVPKRETGL